MLTKYEHAVYVLALLLFLLVVVSIAWSAGHVAAVEIAR